MAFIRRFFTKEYLLLFAIFLFALCLRSFALGQEPAGLFRDELISGYIGRYILLNGKDLYGHILPFLYFDKYGDYPPVLPMYFSGIGTFFFGLTVFAIRFPVALIGAFIVFPLYACIKYIFKNKAIGLLAALFIAIMPWHIILSRATSEGVITLTIFVSGLYLFLRGIYEEKIRFLIAGIVLFLVTYLFYPSYRITMPLFLLPMSFIFLRSDKIIRRILIISVIVAFGLTIAIGSTKWGQGRYKETSLFTNYEVSGVKSRLDLLTQEEGTNNVLTARIFHNKIVGFTREIAYQYMNYFSVRYLFTKGGLPARYSVPDAGLLYMTSGIFLIAGLFFLIRVRDKKFLLVLLVLFIISPLPAPVTIDDIPNVHRTLLMVLPLTLLMAYGSYALYNALPKKLRAPFVAICALLLLAECVYFSHEYLDHIDAYQSVNHGDTNKEFIQKIIQLASSYDKVIISVNDAMPLYYLYFSNNFSKSLAGTLQSRLRMNHVGNVSFVDSLCPTDALQNIKKGASLLVANSDGSCKAPSAFHTLVSFKRHDGTGSYVIYSAK